MTGSPTTVSVIIPSYNRRSALQKCLHALNEQTATDFEVVVVDDGSSDDTVEMLERWDPGRSRFALRWIRNLRNLGANCSRNIGVQASCGLLIAFLDSDCVPARDWLEQITGVFEDRAVAAATGLVEEDCPRNIFEKTLWGVNRVHGGAEAERLVAGNLCVRREWLVRFPFDEDLKYGCDEEGLFLKLRAARARQSFITDALVTHEHRFDGRSFFRQAWVGGRGAAWLVYKYGLPPRVDLILLALCYLTLPLVAFGHILCVVPIMFFLAQIAALVFNDLWRKHKSAASTAYTLPVLLAYYHVRLAAYAASTVRLRSSGNTIERVSLSAIRPVGVGVVTKAAAVIPGREHPPDGHDG